VTVEDTIKQYIIDQWETYTPTKLINTATQLQAINDNLSGDYTLNADIDLDGVDFTPLGNDAEHFSGTFDGNGHTISNLTITGTDDNVGLFGHVGTEEGTTTIKDLFLTGFSIEGNEYVGTLIGRTTGNSDTTVMGCYAESSTVTGLSEVGGLCGSWSSFEESVGGTNNPVMSNCHADVTVTGGTGGVQIGGLIGCGQRGTVINCYAHGDVTGDGGDAVGGLVGCIAYNGIIEDCYSIGVVTDLGDGTDYGGLIGNNTGLGSNDGEVSESYWDTTTSGQATSAGGTGLTTSEMQDPANFATWDTEVWTLTDGSYPSLTYATTSTEYTNYRLPVFVSDYDMIHGQMQERDTIYIIRTSYDNTVKGIGYHARDRVESYQLHLYGPSRDRGDAIRTKLEGILDDRALRMRYDGIDGLLFVDGGNRMEGMKRAYGQVYDIRIQYRGEII